jgi:hypothetical protein
LDAERAEAQREAQIRAALAAQAAAAAPQHDVSSLYASTLPPGGGVTMTPAERAAAGAPAPAPQYGVSSLYASTLPPGGGVLLPGRSLPPMTPAEHAMVQQALDKANAKAVTSPGLSAHEQAARIRAQRTFVSPRPSPAMTERQQLQTTLSIGAGYKKQNLAMIAGLVIAGGAAIFLVSTFLTGRRR